jgi:hypothetical protein
MSQDYKEKTTGQPSGHGLTTQFPLKGKTDEKKKAGAEIRTRVGGSTIL